jgi:isoprenylcysteine carboxyl methyltransferase (ICMT) family protein YpbQ
MVMETVIYNHKIFKHIHPLGKIWTSQVSLNQKHDIYAHWLLKFSAAIVCWNSPLLQVA